MNILIPVDDSDIEEAKLCSIEDVQYWLVFDLIEGKVSNTQFYQSREEISDWLDVVIVKDQKEHIWPFMEEGIAVLVAPTQRYVDDIVEAYLFKELHDMNV
jgi:predicted Fe-Mo cluster-binding NifX family protein